MHGRAARCITAPSKPPQQQAPEQYAACMHVGSTYCEEGLGVAAGVIHNAYCCHAVHDAVVGGVERIASGDVQPVVSKHPLKLQAGLTGSAAPQAVDIWVKVCMQGWG